MYHRIAEEACDPWGLSVSTRNFDAQMAWLAANDAAVDLAAFAGDGGYSYDGGRLAVTFDDGYIDNIVHALPVLERHNIPATIFVVGNAIGRRREFWWDALQRALLESGALPALLDFPFGKGPHDYRLDEQPGDHGQTLTWRADEEDAQTPRQKLFLALWEAIVVLEPDEQDAAVDHILAWAGMPVTPLASRLPATAEEFQQLVRHPLISIGSHTLDHRSLPDLSDAAQQDQIVRGHHMMEEMVGKRIDRFSYPFGRMDARAQAHVRALGVDVACTSAAMVATPRMDRHALPRLQATDLEAGDFASWLIDDHGLLANAELP